MKPYIFLEVILEELKRICIPFALMIEKFLHPIFVMFQRFTLWYEKSDKH